MKISPDPGNHPSIHFAELLPGAGAQPRAELHYTVTEELPASLVQLGRFIINSKEPSEEYCDPLPHRPTAQELGTVIWNNYEEILRASSPIIRSYINNIFSAPDKNHDTALRAPQITTYKLRNSAMWFKDACSEPKTRKFLEEKICEGRNIYLVVGLNVGWDVTITHGSTVATNIGASSSRTVNSTTINYAGKSVLAIEYQKLKFQSLYRNIDNISPSTYSKWERILHNERETRETEWKPSDEDKQENSIPKNEENSAQEAHTPDASDSDTSVEVNPFHGLRISARAHSRSDDEDEDETDPPRDKCSSIVALVGDGHSSDTVSCVDSGISGCASEKYGDYSESEIDWPEEENYSLAEAKESFEQVQATLEPSIQEEKRRAHPQPATTQNTCPDTVGSFIANESDVLIVNSSSGSLSLPSSSYIPPSEPFSPMHGGQIDDDSATSMDSQLTALEDEPKSHKLFERNSSTPILQHVPDACPKLSPTSHSSITPSIHSSHVSSPNRSAEEEEEPPKAHPETLAPVKSPTPTYQNLAQVKEVDSVAYETPRAASSHTLLGGSRHLEAASWATLEDMRIHAGSQAAPVSPTESGHKAKVEPEPVFCKRTTSWFEDTMWSTKYMISRLEFSIMRASHKRSEAFPTRMSWKCVSSNTLLKSIYSRFWTLLK